MEPSQHRAYQIGFQLGTIAWEIVKRWDVPTRISIGNQLTRAADSLSSNIVEGWKRYHKKDKILFMIYARASFEEALEWMRKARSRNLISEEEYSVIQNLTTDFPREINGLIKGIKQNLKY